MFPAGVFEIVKYHLVTQRLGLKDKVQWPQEAEKGAGKELGVGRKVRTLVWTRLRGNVDTGIIGRWQEVCFYPVKIHIPPKRLVSSRVNKKLQALAIMAQPTHVPDSLSELAKLSDEIWFLAGDMSVDTSWYTKRASLSAVYAATEVFMTQDQSSDFKDTEKFLDTRLEEVVKAGGALQDAGEWLGFTGHSIVNVLRSKGMRI